MTRRRYLNRYNHKLRSCLVYIMALYANIWYEGILYRTNQSLALAYGLGDMFMAHVSQSSYESTYDI